MSEEICKSSSIGVHQCELLQGHKGDHKAYEGTQIVAAWYERIDNDAISHLQADYKRLREALKFSNETIKNFRQSVATLPSNFYTYPLLAELERQIKSNEEALSEGEGKK